MSTVGVEGHLLEAELTVVDSTLSTTPATRYCCKLQRVRPFLFNGLTEQEQNSIPPPVVMPPIAQSRVHSMSVQEAADRRQGNRRETPTESTLGSAPDTAETQCLIGEMRSPTCHRLR